MASPPKSSDCYWGQFAARPFRDRYGTGTWQTGDQGRPDRFPKTASGNARPPSPAIQRIAVVWDIPIACNRTSADYLITSPLLRQARRASRRPLSGART
jgi:hypothetical protein